MSVKPQQWQLNLPAEIAEAKRKIASTVQTTPLSFSEFYSELTGANVYLKCENLQTTGSFKLRGAANKYWSVAPEERRQVVAASTGNHGKAVAYVASRFGTGCKIFAPQNAQTRKLDAIARLGAEVQLVGNDCVEAEHHARNFANSHSMAYISPYNDPLVIAGQGTIGAELNQQCESIDAVFAAVGGGGMLGGIAAAVQDMHPKCSFIACSPQNSCVLIQSLQAGKLLDLPSLETLSDGTAGGVESDSITFGLCRALISGSVLVSELEIATALQQFIDTHSMLIEAAAAVPIAALLKNAARYAGKNVVVVLCGANISFDTLVKCASCGDDEHQPT